MVMVSKRAPRRRRLAPLAAGGQFARADAHPAACGAHPAAAALVPAAEPDVQHDALLALTSLAASDTAARPVAHAEALIGCGVVSALVAGSSLSSKLVQRKVARFSAKKLSNGSWRDDHKVDSMVSRAWDVRQADHGVEMSTRALLNS